MKNVWFAAVGAVLVSLTLISVAAAQAAGLTLSLSRDFGYGGFNSDIQGVFSMHVSGPANLTRVEFFIDTTKIGESTKAPFGLQFNTDAFPLGVHSLSATGYTADGQVLRSETISANFVSASAGSKAALRIVIPLLAVIFGAMLLAAVIPIVTGRRTVPLSPGAPREYKLGGVICPKCQRPFGVHFYGMNLLGSKLDRCPYCGRWSLVRRVPLTELHSAEQAELERAKTPGIVTSGDEELKKELDDSKYQGL
jgi:hypothetical protein